MPFPHEASRLVAFSALKRDKSRRFMGRTRNKWQCLREDAASTDALTPMP